MEVKKDNSRSRSFKDLDCWQKAHDFVKTVYATTKYFPEEERYGLTSQFRRAAVSIATNICEGYRKLSRADKLRFLNIAQGWFLRNHLFSPQHSSCKHDSAFGLSKTFT